jgi:hypothetical protein
MAEGLGRWRLLGQGTQQTPQTVAFNKAGEVIPRHQARIAAGLVAVFPFWRRDRFHDVGRTESCLRRARRNRRIKK